MQVQMRIKNNALVVKLVGDLDHHSASLVRGKIEEVIINKAAKNLIFDLSELSFMDSSGIGMIIGRYKLMSALGGQVQIICKNKQIEKLINMSGLKRLIKIYSDLDDAFEAI